VVNRGWRQRERQFNVRFGLASTSVQVRASRNAELMLAAAVSLPSRLPRADDGSLVGEVRFFEHVEGDEMARATRCGQSKKNTSRFASKVPVARIVNGVEDAARGRAMETLLDALRDHSRP